LHEELNEDQKKEIEQQITQERRIRNGKVEEVVTTTVETTKTVDTAAASDFTLLPHTPRTQYQTNIASHPHPLPQNTNQSHRIPISSHQPYRLQHHTTQYQGIPYTHLQNNSHVNPQPHSQNFTLNNTPSTGWKHPGPQIVAQTSNLSRQAYMEYHVSSLQRINSLLGNRQQPFNANSSTPYAIPAQSNNAHPHITVGYGEDSSTDKAARFKQQMENLKLDIDVYRKQFTVAEEPVSGDVPNNSSL
jgi:hypothetical protein